VTTATQKDKIEATRLGVRDAWDFWLDQHPISVPEIIQLAAREAVADWLDVHGKDVFGMCPGCGASR
jgi:hypothetical protein